ncbi:hypothetical protein BB561_000391 [Smittium simulii]|uniref:Propionate--CoA ligase n=1 Tax=Smittium simulii TaxID=133385 RepID=A0A2T9YZM8_9FUNG|nr:hypothetical protein BB561_000391 [Smittium simulii]
MELNAVNPPIIKYEQQKLHDFSLADPEKFWLNEARELVSWSKLPSKALHYKEPKKPHLVSWFPDGKLNICYNALDRHIEAGYGEQIAVIYDSPVTHTIKKITYNYMLKRVKDFSKVLKNFDVNKGDTVIIYMPMIPETLVAMLSCVRIGAIHSVVFGGFAPRELAKRIDDCKPKLILTATCGIEKINKIIEYIPLVNEALKISLNPPKHKIIFQREALGYPIDYRNGDVDWVSEIAKAAKNPEAKLEQLSSSDTMYILYTSGTTGAPKGVSRPTGPHAVALIYAMRKVYGALPGETFFASSDFGWAVGHSLTCYGALMNRNTTIVYEGKPVETPDPGAFFRVIEEHNVKVFFTAPTALMILRREDSDGEYRKKYNISNIKGFFVSGERCVPDIHKWWIKNTTGILPRGSEMSFESANKISNITTDQWWQTESGTPLTAYCQGYAKTASELPTIRFGSVGFPVPGVDLRVIKVNDDNGEDELNNNPDKLEEASPGEVGSIAIKLPLPPGALDTLWKNQERFYNEYFKRFPGYYATGDTGMIDKDGYVYILSRDDDVMNIAAHRISTSTIEEVVSEHPKIAECCVVPCPDEIKGQVPMVFAVLKKSNVNVDATKIAQEVATSIRNRVGAIVSLSAKNVLLIEKLPKTRSGKILRKMIRTMIKTIIISKQNPEIITIDLPATIDDTTSAANIWKVLIKHLSNPKSKL